MAESSPAGSAKSRPRSTSRAPKRLVTPSNATAGSRGPVTPRAAATSEQLPMHALKALLLLASVELKSLLSTARLADVVAGQLLMDSSRELISLALQLLQPAASDSVLDLFCGLGNFTLPVARRAGRVIGVEGEAGLVARARANAAANGITNAEFHVADLSGDPGELPWARGAFERVLLDPPRAGAAGVLPLIGRLRPARIVYVSCHPASLARDAGSLVNQHGYRLAAAGVMDMFPHTAHVESIAVFEDAS